MNYLIKSKDFHPLINLVHIISTTVQPVPFKTTSLKMSFIQVIDLTRKDVEFVTESPAMFMMRMARYEETKRQFKAIYAVMFEKEEGGVNGIACQNAISQALRTWRLQNGFDC